MTKPNLFKLATKELSQDSFFGLAFTVPDDACRTDNAELNLTGKDFIRLLAGRYESYKVSKVNAGR